PRDRRRHLSCRHLLRALGETCGSGRTIRATPCRRPPAGCRDSGQDRRQSRRATPRSSSHEASTWPAPPSRLFGTQTDCNAQPVAFVFQSRAKCNRTVAGGIPAFLSLFPCLFSVWRVSRARFEPHTRAFAAFRGDIPMVAPVSEIPVISAA